MAKYADYVKNDELDTEIEEAAAETEERREVADTLPAKFKGKSAEEIAASYSELEQAFSRQGQQLGTMRAQYDQLIELELQRTREGTKPEAKPITVDDLYENPDETVRKIAREESETRIKELERKAEEAERKAALVEAKAALTRQFPSWEQDIADPKFIEWIKEKPYRVQAAVAADKGDMGAAETLFGAYNDHKELSQKKETKAQRQQAIEEASLETSGGGVPETVPTLSRTEYIQYKTAALQGSRKAQAWLDRNRRLIEAAYSGEGRLVD